MYLIYIDETKISIDRPDFYIGGVFIRDDVIGIAEERLARLQSQFFGSTILKKEQEFHGDFIFNGRGPYRSINLNHRLELYESLLSIVLDLRIDVRVTALDVKEYAQNAVVNSVYNMGLQYMLFDIVSFLEQKDDRCLVFADHEKDEITSAIETYSEIKMADPILRKKDVNDKTWYDRVIDTIYFTQSHHSRFIQLADVMMYLVTRNYRREKFEKYHEQRLRDMYVLLQNSGLLNVMKIV